MDLSLDDIIKKKKITVKGKGGFKKPGVNTAGSNRGNVQGNGARRQGGPGPQQRRAGAPNAGRVGAQNTGRVGVPNTGRLGAQNATVRQKPIGDARNRIIQKKRQNITDARDKLCELAKKTDVRLKLEKLREMRMGHEGMTAHLGYNGLHTIAQKPLRNTVKGFPSRANLDHPSLVTLQRTISQPSNFSRYTPTVPSLMDMDLNMADEYSSGGVLPLRRTVNNDQMRRETLLRPSKLSNPSPYSWKAPQRVAPANPNRGYIDLDYPVEERKRMKLPSPPALIRPIVVSDDEDMPEPARTIGRSTRLPSGNAMSVAKSRLQSSRVQPSSHTSASTSTAGSSGYRIVVSNLQSTVTHEDIRELFEDIGPLVASRLVRPGTAEVVYRQYEDAERAVENYHNRQLDGQPMKCLLVKPRTPSAPSATAGGTLRSASGPSAKSASGKSSVVPDINTIHKALFNKS